MNRSKSPPKQKRELFLSHSSKDREFVVRLVSVLKRHGVRYWYSATHISGAKQWHDEIGHALRRCDWFLVVLTPSAVQSQWVKRELLFALNEDRYNEKIIPVLRKPSNIQDYLGHCLNFNSWISLEVSRWAVGSFYEFGRLNTDRRRLGERVNGRKFDEDRCAVIEKNAHLTVNGSFKTPGSEL